MTACIYLVYRDTHVDAHICMHMQHDRLCTEIQIYIRVCIHIYVHTLTNLLDCGDMCICKHMHIHMELPDYWVPRISLQHTATH